MSAASPLRVSPLRVGIVGANAERGWAKDAHVPALRVLPEFNLTAVCARTQETADAAASELGAQRGYTDALALVRAPDIDIVTVTVRVPEHHAVVLAALEAGKHVYCEWPLTPTAREADGLAAAAKASGAHVVIGLQGLSSPTLRHAQHLVRHGALGELQVLRVYSPTAGWGARTPAFYAYLQDKANGATLPTVAGGHTLAAMEALGGPYSTVDARLTTLRRNVELIGANRTIERTSADHMLVLGTHRSGCVSTLEVAGGDASGAFRLELTGTAGRLSITGASPGGYQVGALKLETSFEAPPVPAPIAGLSGPAAHVAEAYARLAADIATGERTAPDFIYAARLTRLLEAIERASEHGQREDLKD